MMMLAICLSMACSSSEDDYDNVNPKLLIGKWEASHHSKNPKYGDTCDMWDFTFNADGTGSGEFGTGTFGYQINDNIITLHLLNTEAYFGRTEFLFKIVSMSKDSMEWDEIPNENWGDNSLYLKFYRK